MKSQFIGRSSSVIRSRLKPLTAFRNTWKKATKLHHCVFTNDYALKPESLCLSARIDEQPIETIEVDLSKMA